VECQKIQRDTAQTVAGSPAVEAAIGPLAPWLRASAADLANLDFEGPITGSTSANSHDLSERYGRAAGLDAGAAVPDTSEARLLAMLSAVAGMRPKAREDEEPFGPMYTFADGSSSAIPSDLRHRHLDLLAEMAMWSGNRCSRLG
jgi:hypothetical protein